MKIADGAAPRTGVGTFGPKRILAVPLRRALNQVRQDVRRVRTPGSFARNTFHVFSGNSLSMLSQLILTPIIARIYGPEAYGVFGLFTALMMNLASFGDFGYTMAYVLPRDEDRFRDLVRLNLGLTASACGLFFLVTLNRDLVYDLLPGWRPLGPWIHLVAVVAGCYTLSVMATQWLTRAKLFKRSAFTGATIEISLRLFNLVYGIVSKAQVTGLILADVVVRLGIVPVYAHGVRNHGLREVLSNWRWERIRSIALEYRRYPLLVFPERWVSLLGTQLPIFMLASDLESVGRYSLGASLLLMPLRLLGFSMNTVYLQRVAEIRNAADGELQRITRGLYQRLFWIGIGPFLLLTFFSDEAFAVVFGEPWRGAGTATAYLGGFFFFRLITEPMISVFNVLGREHVMLVFQIIINIFRFLALYLVLNSGADSDAAILAYGLVSMAGYVILNTILLNATRCNGAQLVFRSVMIMLLFAALTSGLRFAILGTWWP